MRENMRIRIVPHVPKLCLTTRSRSNKRREGGKRVSPPPLLHPQPQNFPFATSLSPLYSIFFFSAEYITQSKREKEGREGIKKILMHGQRRHASRGLVSFNFGSCHRHSKLFSSSSGKGGEACLLVCMAGRRSSCFA